MSTTVSATPKRVRIPHTRVFIDCTCDAMSKDDCACIRALTAADIDRLVEEDEVARSATIEASAEAREAVAREIASPKSALSMLGGFFEGGHIDLGAATPTDELAKAVAQYARHCLRKASASGKVDYPRCELVVSDRSPEQRALLAVGLDLLDVLRQSSDGREALKNLGLEPFAEGAKRE